MEVDIRGLLLLLSIEQYRGQFTTSMYKHGSSLLLLKVIFKGKH